MFNLFEIMQGAQGGNAYQTLANQFGIGQQQAQQAVEAVLPPSRSACNSRPRPSKGGRIFSPRSANRRTVPSSMIRW